MGKPYPVYRVFNDAVQLTIASATEYVDFVKFIVYEPVLSNMDYWKHQEKTIC